jgi:hypothetical protein
MDEMSDTKALDNVVEQNRLSIGEFCRHDDILWIEGQQAAAELEQLKAELEEAEELMKDIVNSSLCYLEASILKDTTEWLNKHSKEK